MTDQNIQSNVAFAFGDFPCLCAVFQPSVGLGIKTKRVHRWTLLVVYAERRHMCSAAVSAVSAVSAAKQLLPLLLLLTHATLSWRQLSGVGIRPLFFWSRQQSLLETMATRKYIIVFSRSRTLINGVAGFQ